MNIHRTQMQEGSKSIMIMQCSFPLFTCNTANYVSQWALQSYPFLKNYGIPAKTSLTLERITSDALSVGAEFPGNRL